MSAHIIRSALLVIAILIVGLVTASYAAGVIFN